MESWHDHDFAHDLDAPISFRMEPVRRRSVMGPVFLVAGAILLSLYANIVLHFVWLSWLCGIPVGTTLAALAIRWDER